MSSELIVVADPNGTSQVCAPAEAERRVADLAEICGQWMWETDADGRLTYVSTLPGSLADLTTRPILGRSWAELVEPFAAAGDGWLRCETEMAARRPFEAVRCRLDGIGEGPRHLRLSGRPMVDQAGKFLGYRGVAADVSRAAENRLRAADARRQAMEILRKTCETAILADESKTRFLAAASHDLRQPLQALGLFVAALAHKPLEDDLRQIVDRIQASLAALEHLLETILDISRFDAGAVETRSTSFPLQRLFARLAAEFEPVAEDKGLAMRFVPTSHIVVSDPMLLERILRNLVSNAVRYTGRGGVVVGCRRRGDSLRVEVWDSGPGIAPAEQREIFREFHQLNDALRGPRQGSGLGLAIVDRLADLLGHQIDLHSIPGKGSVFAVVVPLAEAVQPVSDST